MKRSALHSRSLLLLTVLAVASCSQGPSSATAITNRPEKVAEIVATDGSVRGSAAGDVKSGPIEIDLVRVSQSDGVPAFYAFANGEYIVRPGREVEIYVQIWTASPAVATPPRVIVDWGVGGADSTDNIHCGPCRLSRTYRTEGRYTVKVTMDDRVGGVTSRTFTLNVANPTAESSGFGTFNGTLSTSDPQWNRTGQSSPCAISGNVPNYYDTYSINHLGGPLSLEITAGSFDTYLHLYSGSFNPGSPCQNWVEADDDDGAGLLSLIQRTVPAGSYVVVVSSFDTLGTGSYTLVIQ